MSDRGDHRWIHRLAWLTAVIALLPISVGAVVTTVGAGMAFADWPTSDGHSMLAYPWLQSTGDRFLEHGHRLAGMLIGVVTLVLAAVAHASDCRWSVRVLVTAILGAVIAQGLLGGSRVIQNEQVLAFLHGQFAAFVFSLMGLLVVMTAGNWFDQPLLADGPRGRIAFAAGLVTLGVLATQYVLGGLLRHLGSSTAWLVHPWLAVGVAVAAIGFCWLAARTGEAELAKAGRWVLAFVVAQAALGLVTWGVKYGFPQWNVMAVQQSSLQVAVRSLHKVLGLLTVMTTVVAIARIWRRLPARKMVAAPLSLAGGVTAGGAT